MRKQDDEIVPMRAISHVDARLMEMARRASVIKKWGLQNHVKYERK